MLKQFKVTAIAPYFALIAAVSTAFGYLYTQFTPLRAHEALAQQVTETKLELLKEKLMSEVFFLRDQSRKYPNDMAIKDQLAKAELRLADVEAKLQGGK